MAINRLEQELRRLAEEKNKGKVTFVPVFIEPASNLAAESLKLKSEMFLYGFCESRQEALKQIERVGGKAPQIIDTYNNGARFQTQTKNKPVTELEKKAQALHDFAAPFEGDMHNYPEYYTINFRTLFGELKGTGVDEFNKKRCKLGVLWLLEQGHTINFLLDRLDFHQCFHNKLLQKYTHSEMRFVWRNWRHLKKYYDIGQLNFYHTNAKGDFQKVAAPWISQPDIIGSYTPKNKKKTLYDNHFNGKTNNINNTNKNPSNDNSLNSNTYTQNNPLQNLLILDVEGTIIPTYRFHLPPDKDGHYPAVIDPELPKILKEFHDEGFKILLNTGTNSDTIDHYMKVFKHANIAHLIDATHPNTCTDKDNDDKVTKLNKYCNQFGIDESSKQNVYFYDDGAPNIERAQQAGFVNSFVVSNSSPLHTQLKNLLKTLRPHKPQETAADKLFNKIDSLISPSRLDNTSLKLDLDQTVTFFSFSRSLFSPCTQTFREYLKDMATKDFTKANNIYQALLNGNEVELRTALSKHRFLSFGFNTVGTTILNKLI